MTASIRSVAPAGNSPLAGQDIVSLSHACLLLFARSSFDTNHQYYQHQQSESNAQNGLLLQFFVSFLLLGNIVAEVLIHLFPTLNTSQRISYSIGVEAVWSNNRSRGVRLSKRG